MRLLVDMDGILSDWTKIVVKVLKERDIDLLPPEQWISWNVEEWAVPSQKSLAKKIIENLMIVEGFWESLPPIDGAIEYFNKLLDLPDVSVFIGTVPWWSAPRCVDEKMRWIRKHLPRFHAYENTFLGYRKEMILADVLIDDRAKNINCWTTEVEGRKGIVFDRSYNRNIFSSDISIEPTLGVARVSGWPEAYETVLVLFDRWIKEHNR